MSFWPHTGDGNQDEVARLRADCKALSTALRDVVPVLLGALMDAEDDDLIRLRSTAYRTARAALAAHGEPE